MEERPVGGSRKPSKLPQAAFEVAQQYLIQPGRRIFIHFQLLTGASLMRRAMLLDRFLGIVTRDPSRIAFKRMCVATAPPPRRRRQIDLIQIELDGAGLLRS
jgi:hypothetical protein